MAIRLDAFQQYNEVADRDFVYNGRWGFAPSLAFGLGTPTRVTLSYLHSSENDLPDYGFPFVNAAAIKAAIFPSSQLNQVAPSPLQQLVRPGQPRPRERAITDHADAEDRARLR